ncbi:MAG: Rieske (2Fe-2S) protein [Bacteroidota bacterium]|nr:Rieske (2Fe-2S) protein [Bacteroidota bacterium]
MNRKTFLKTCGVACIGGSMFSVLISGCAGSKMVSGNVTGDYLIISADEFSQVKKELTTYRKYVIVKHPQMKYPVCVYRLSETDYSALLMKCTHQGNELTAYGEKLHCAAHGSEFDRQGIVRTGPANQSLRKFPVILENNQVKISLKA